MGFPGRGIFCISKLEGPISNRMKFKGKEVITGVLTTTGLEQST